MRLSLPAPRFQEPRKCTTFPLSACYPKPESGLEPPASRASGGKNCRMKRDLAFSLPSFCLARTISERTPCSRIA